LLVAHCFLLTIGIDPADPSKTAVTLELFTNIFSWIPITSSTSLENGNLANYTDLLSFPANTFSSSAASTASSVPSNVTCVVTKEEYEIQRDLLFTYITDEWIAGFFEKIFLLIDGLEQKVKGTKDSHIISSISQSVGFIFQALLKQEEKLADDIEEKILFYLLSSAPLHTYKVAGKLMESITSNDQRKLKYFFEKILDKEVIGKFMVVFLFVIFFLFLSVTSDSFLFLLVPVLLLFVFYFSSFLLCRFNW
jgi:ABC-type multidrug transport system fused ATPase/permease subunit